MKILVVEDSKVVIAYVREVLGNLKHEVVHAENGQIGVELLEKEKGWDLILLDWNMPVLNGPGLLEAVRDKKIPTPPIVMMTTENSPEKIQEALDKGACEYIMKPFTADILICKINMVLGVCNPI